MWGGNAFDCILNEILLRHSQFASPGTSGTCNNAMRARSVGVVNTDSYISELSVTVSTTFNNRIIRCSHNSGTGERIIGTSTLTVVSGKNRLLVTIVSQASSHSRVKHLAMYRILRDKSGSFCTNVRLAISQVSVHPGQNRELCLSAHELLPGTLW